MKKSLIIASSLLILLTGCSKKSNVELGEISSELPNEVVDRENKTTVEKRVRKNIINRIKSDDSIDGYTESSVSEDSNDYKKHSVINVEIGSDIYPIHLVEYTDPDHSEYNSTKTNGRYEYQGKNYKVWAYGGTLVFVETQEVDPKINSLITDSVKDN